MMIAINKVKRVEKGITCGVCHGDTAVKELKFKADDSPGGTCVFICARCRDELTNELGLVKFYEECK